MSEFDLGASMIMAPSPQPGDVGARPISEFTSGGDPIMLALLIPEGLGGTVSLGLQTSGNPQVSVGRVRQYSAGQTLQALGANDFLPAISATLEAPLPRPSVSWTAIEPVGLYRATSAGEFVHEGEFGQGAGNAVATGDLNGDEVHDLVIALSRGGILIVLSGTDQGMVVGNSISYALSISDLNNDYEVGRFPMSLAAGDFDSDGIMDLVVSTGSELQMLKGETSGTFSLGEPVYTHGTVSSLVASDFNGDLVPDVAVTHAAGTVEVLLSSESKALQSAMEYPVPGTPWHVTAGDLNSDGLPDLAVVNAGATVSIF